MSVWRQAEGRLGGTIWHEEILHLPWKRPFSPGAKCNQLFLLSQRKPCKIIRDEQQPFLSGKNVCMVISEQHPKTNSPVGFSGIPQCAAFTPIPASWSQVTALVLMAELYCLEVTGYRWSHTHLYIANSHSALTIYIRSASEPGPSEQLWTHPPTRDIHLVYHLIKSIHLINSLITVSLPSIYKVFSAIPFTEFNQVVYSQGNCINIVLE